MYPSFGFLDKPCKLTRSDQLDSRLMTLPRELRDKIFRYLLKEDGPIQYGYQDLGDDFDTSSDKDSDGDENMTVEAEDEGDHSLRVQLLEVCQQT